MGLFDIFKKKEQLPKGVKRIFETMERNLQGKKLAEEAISYRNLGDHEKALTLLMRSLNEYDYKPALLLIGTTAVVKGDIDGAIEWFNLVINKYSKDDIPLIEIYANLGSIYRVSRQEYNKSIDMYRSALEAPRPVSRDDFYYAVASSEVYLGMAVAFFELGDYSDARAYAIKRLDAEPDCSDSKEIIALCEKYLRTYSVALNRYGREGATVEYQPDGRNLIKAGENADFISALQSIWQITWGEKVTGDDRLIFSRLMNLSENSISMEHREVFSNAMLHFFVELKKSERTVPNSIAKVLLSMPEIVLPPLPRPLSDEIRNIFLKLFT